MYAKKIEIENYGPISQLDITLPFEGDLPKPIVLVGENGSGKSVFLSHVVNGLVSAKGRAYSESPEIETGKVFKLRSPSYIGPNCHWSYVRVDFDQDISIGELTLSTLKRELGTSPPDFALKRAEDAWHQMNTEQNTHLISNIYDRSESEVRDIFTNNCVLYFPHNRFEEPAWLNEENLKAQAEYMEIKHIQGFTNRRLINYSSLHDNQDWLFSVAYDRAVFESRTINFPLQVQGDDKSVGLPLWTGYSGSSTNVFDIALDVIRRIMGGDSNLNIGIGRRLNRTLSLQSDRKIIVPNIFQLSSGETSLLNLFLSVLRDFDLSGTSFSSADQVRGIVVVDEIDLHLHAVHQHEVLPSLMQMFPKVQFIVTTHSPLFVLGMNNTFGEDGFALYQLPDGQQISPEEFSEFGSAYEAFKASNAFSDDVRRAIAQVQQPILYVEGSTDVKYLKTAATLLGRNSVFDRIHILEGGGDNLKNVWKVVLSLPDGRVPNRIMVLRDCDYSGDNKEIGNRLKRRIPKQEGHPLKKGIENLFTKATLEKARSHKTAFIDMVDAYKRTVRGEERTIPETWTVNSNEKTNLCNWLCQNGTAEDFQHFQVIFDLLDELVDLDDPT